MNQDIIKELESNMAVFENLLKNIGNELIRWKENDNQWSLLDIVCHLYDEEREDFRYRLNQILTHPNDELPSINPQAWITDRKYRDQNYKQKLNDFLHERKESILWLKSLRNPLLDNFYSHPTLGKMTANMVFSEWLSHDFLHLRQIIKMKYFYYKTLSPSPLNYAGEW